MGLYDISFPGANETIEYGQLAEINDALRRAARGLAKTVVNVGGTVGYPQQAVAYLSPSDTFVDPLLPQSIQPVLTNFDFNESHLWFFQMVAKVQATSTLHEYSSIRQHGTPSLNPFFAQGGVAPLSQAKYARGTVKIKFLMEYMQVSDVAAMLGTVTNGTVLAQLTLDHTVSLMRKIEHSMFWADESVNPLAFNGLYKAIKNANNDATAATNGIGTQTYWDNEGNELSGRLLNYYLSILKAAPRYGNPTHILCTPEQFEAFKNQLLVLGRQFMGQGDGYLSLSPEGGIYATGMIPIVPVTFLAYPKGILNVSVGDEPPTLITPTIGLEEVLGLGKWTAYDKTKDTHVAVVAIGEGGNSAPKFATVQIGDNTGLATDTITIDIVDTGAPWIGAANSLIYYSVFLAQVAIGGADPSLWDYTWVGDFARVPGTNTAITLRNQKRIGTAPVYIIELKPEVMQFTQLLDLTRRNITVSKTTATQFGIMMFGSFTLMVPHRNFIIDNVLPGFTLNLTDAVSLP